MKIVRAWTTLHSSVLDHVGLRFVEHLPVVEASASYSLHVRHRQCAVYFAIAPSLVQIAATVEPVDIQEPFLRLCPQFEFFLFIFA